MAEAGPIPISRPKLPKTVGRYQIAGELGQGGMGAIYLGRSVGIGGFERLVAIKMIHRHLSREQTFIDMFLDEARIAALIRHPNVVSVFEVGEHEGRYFIAMDYVSGEPLSILLDRTWGREKTLPADMMAHVVSIACEGLHAAHELEDPSTGDPLNVVHRDVCPQNIMIGYDGIVRVMDFGVAKAAGQLAMTMPGTQKGKVPYMSPEQIRGKPIDRRSDVFALGIVLWECTVGKRLFKDENNLRSAARVLKGKVPKPSQLMTAYPPALEKIIMKALEPKAKRRFQTARELGAALDEFLAECPVLSAQDLSDLMGEHCGDRQKSKREIERRASTEDLDGDPIIDPVTQQLFIGDESLPAMELEDDEDDDESLDEVSAVLLAPAGTDEEAEVPPPRRDVRTEELDLGSVGFAAPARKDTIDERPPPLDEPVVEPDTKHLALAFQPKRSRMPLFVMLATIFAVFAVAMYVARDTSRPAADVSPAPPPPVATPTPEPPPPVPAPPPPVEPVEPMAPPPPPVVSEPERVREPPPPKRKRRKRRRRVTRKPQKQPFLVGPEDL